MPWNRLESTPSGGARSVNHEELAMVNGECWSVRLHSTFITPHSPLNHAAEPCPDSLFY